MAWYGPIWLVKQVLKLLCTVLVVVGIVSRHGLSIDTCENQRNKYKVALYKPSIHFNSNLKWFCISSKTEHFSHKDGWDLTCIEALKEQLAWATYKPLMVNT